MASQSPAMRPLACWKFLLRQSRIHREQKRCLATAVHAHNSRPPPPPPMQVASANTVPGYNPIKGMQRIKTYPPPPSARAVCKDPIAALTTTQLTTLDPQGARAKLFSKQNPEAAKVGDILLVRLKNGDDFAGVCMNIRRRGIDTAILLRGNLTRVGVEMWYKVYSPNVDGIEVVQRREKRARRARLYYLRKPKHDVGSVENIVRQYQRQRAMLRSADVRSRDANSNKKKSNKKGKK